MITQQSVKVPLTSSTNIEIKVNSLNWISLNSTRDSDAKQLVSFDLQDQEETRPGFQIEPAEKFSYLTSENFDRLIAGLAADETLKYKIGQVCDLIYMGMAVLNSSHLCTTLAYNETATLHDLSAKKLLGLNKKLTLTINGVDFYCGFLFGIDSKDGKMDFTLKDDHIIGFTNLEFRFPFSRSDRNLLGMNFLDKKIIFIDYYGMSLTISQCLGGLEECSATESPYYGVTQRAIKILIDIIMFIMFVTLIFSSLISYDKFTNDEEYSKE
jgi:hypothetical protein